MKGYSKLETAQVAAERLRARGYTVTVETRNGWWVLNLTGGPFHANDNTPADDRSEA